MEESNNQPEDEMNVYRILLQRHINDDRLLAERTSVFLASSSILFLGFAILPTGAFMLHIFLAIAGLILTFLAFASNRRTGKALDFWEEGEKKIEKTSRNFAYMRENGIEPHRVYERTPAWLRKFRNRYIYTYALTSIFFALWISSLVWVIVN